MNDYDEETYGFLEKGWKLDLLLLNVKSSQSGQKKSQVHENTLLAG